MSPLFLRWLTLGSSALLVAAFATGCATTVGGGDGLGGAGGEGGGPGQGQGGARPGGPCQKDETYQCPAMTCLEGSTGGYQPYKDTLYCEQQPDGSWIFDGQCECPGTPLVLSFDGAPVEYLADGAHGFDLGASASVITDWPTARTPWLALDRDGNGSVDDGRELFGSMTELPGGGRAPNGFVALRALDADGDGRITAADPDFARLLIWWDRDGDRRSSPDELVSAQAAGLVSIDLDYTIDPRCDGRRNCEVERATFRYRDGAGAQRTGAVIDVHLPAQR